MRVGGSGSEGGRKWEGGREEVGVRVGGSGSEGGRKWE